MGHDPEHAALAPEHPAAEATAGPAVAAHPAHAGEVAPKVRAGQATPQGDEPQGDEATREEAAGAAHPAHAAEAEGAGLGGAPVAADEPEPGATDGQDPDPEPRPAASRDAEAHEPQHEASGRIGPTEAAPRHSARDVTQAGVALQASGLELRTLQGRVFGPIDWVLPPRTHGAVLGVQGSGRSAFLLALAGRMRGLTGSLTVGDLDGIRQPRHLRHRTAVARITDLVELEPGLTVAEAVDEHALAEGVSVRHGRATFEALTGTCGVRFERRARVDELSALDRTLLAALLACQRPAHHIVLDDVDDALTTEQLRHVYAVMGLLGDAGHYFVVSALESSEVPAGASVVHLAPPETSDGLQLSFGHLHPRLLAKEA